MHLRFVQRRKTLARPRNSPCSRTGGTGVLDGEMDTEDDEQSAACEECGSTGDSENMLLCDGCVAARCCV